MSKGIVLNAERLLLLQGDIHDNEYGVLITDGYVTVATSEFQTNQNEVLLCGESHVEIIANEFDGNAKDVIYNEEHYRFDGYEIRPFEGEVSRMER